MSDDKPVPNNLLVSGVAVLLLNLLIWGGAGSFAAFLWDFAGRASNCGPRIGVPCPEGTGYGLAGPWVAALAALALLAHLWREGVRGPMPAAAVPFVLGAVLGARFLWSAVFFADDSESRIVMAVVGVLLGGLPGALYGRWLFGRWGAALLLWGVRLDRGGPVPASGPAQEGARNILLALSLTGAVLGCAGGAALV
ncbi:MULTISPECIES: hypothetical protein [Streptomyces]|uniref:Integral membrane protein n=2 Tax=Streptomyces TaxID=1883 RepID=Q9L0K7_STRCO|nr:MULTISPECIES: hypothetical protein [Streptomyces]AIJ13992.1 hypothetical protein SLIV_15055 [Streptomyces lividans TK24]KKD10741.1 membrane protein [Streptomyces sp. WM6391]MDX3424110.1 hypothetical protein [Streptomyces sp. ME02-6985-2c]MYU44177.1 hypothetical protein [Streptomyces sp. SID7813]QSJ09522.1 hypothetical protein SLIVDG2_15055 [Streptomyces lividans]